MLKNQSVLLDVSDDIIRMSQGQEQFACRQIRESVRRIGGMRRPRAETCIRDQVHVRQDGQSTLCPARKHPLEVPPGDVVVVRNSLVENARPESDGPLVTTQNVQEPSRLF
jgi:hypothetical protein